MLVAPGWEWLSSRRRCPIPSIEAVSKHRSTRRFHAATLGNARISEQKKNAKPSLCTCQSTAAQRTDFARHSDTSLTRT